MSFILDQQRDEDCSLAFALYRKYLKLNHSNFPSSAFALASSDWWYDFNDRRCPHDGRIVTVEISESENLNDSTECQMTVILAGAWDGKHRITYHGIIEYNMQAAAPSLSGGHGDWRYD